MKTLLAACLAMLALAAPAFAQSPPQPQMPTGGSERAPREKVVGEAPGQILLRNIVGQPLYGPGINKLGTVTDALIDRRRGVVDVVIIDPIRGSEPRPIAWSSLDINDRKHVTTRLTLAQLQATSPDLQHGKTLEQQAKGKPDLVSAKAQLLGNRVVGRDGKPLGTVRDLVVDAKGGRLVAAVLDAGQGIGFASGAARRVVPWQVVGLPTGKDQPVAIRLTEAELGQEPSMMTKAPVPPEKVGPGVGSSSGTLNNSGHKVPLPPQSPSTRRTD